MISPEFPPNEAERQIALEKYKLLDTLQEDAYDSITALISYICDVPIALITLLDKDRNYVKSNYGISITESPRSTSFCGHAIHSNDAITIVEDAREDIRFIGNPLVVKNNAIFYAGAPLVDADGFKLGVLCVYDHKPRVLNKAQKEALLTLSKQVVHLFEQRYQNFKLEEFQTQLKKRNNNLEKFSGIVSHDLKSPLSNIMALTELLEQENAGKLNQNSLQYLEYLKESSSVLKDYIDGIYTYSWDKDRWRRLVREGWIVVWRNRNKTTQKYNIYKVSTKCKLLINKIYKILLGEADLPVGERHNPFMKGLSYTDKVMKKATELLNNDKTR